jgi:hypothetical protein
MVTPIPDVKPVPDIIIPDLPDNSPPSAITHRAMLQEFYDKLVETLTFAMWLMDKKATECNAIDAEFMNRLDSPRKTMVDNNIIQLLADLKVTRGNPGETDSVFAVRMQ